MKKDSVFVFQQVMQRTNNLWMIFISFIWDWNSKNTYQWHTHYLYRDVYSFAKMYTPLLFILWWRKKWPNSVSFKATTNSFSSIRETLITRPPNRLFSANAEKFTKVSIAFQAFEAFRFAISGSFRLTCSEISPSCSFFHFYMLLKFLLFHECSQTVINTKKVMCDVFWNYAQQKMMFSIKDLFSKCDQVRRKLRIWSHLLKKSLI